MLSIALSLASLHLVDAGHNAFNPGIGLIHDKGAYELEVGAYLNSYYDPSFYAVASKDWGKWGVFGGVASYQAKNVAHMPSIPFFSGELVPVLGIQWTHENMRLRIIPGDGKKTYAVIGLQILIR